MRKLCLVVLLLASSPLFARRGHRLHHEDQGPWFTGTLLAPSAYTLPKGYFYTEPLVVSTDIRGSFDAHWHKKKSPDIWRINPQLPLFYGVTSILEVGIAPQFYHTHRKGASDTVFGDLQAEIALHVFDDKPKEWLPAVKIAVGQLFPTGKYQKLNPKKLGTDLGGIGSYATKIEIDFSKLVAVDSRHHLNTHLSLFYAHYFDTHVQSFNAYGGDPETKGKVSPGDVYGAILGMEYTLAKYVNLACDFVYQSKEANRFHGRTILPVGAPASKSISFAPALEFAFKPNMGLIGGVVFTGFGKNIPNTVSYVASFNIIF